MKISPVRTILQLMIFIILVPFIPLLISWHWDWLEAWVYAAINILGFAISRALAGRRHPDLIAERARIMNHADTKPFDRILAPLLSLGGVLALVVAGLDARFGWSEGFSPAIKILALLVILGGYVLGSYALVENRFFSGVVRIQADRGQYVVTGGPYRWVRHPGYASALLTYLAVPLFLDSWWTFLPVLFITCVLVIRTRLEDATLQEELPGYKEYAAQVRYCLLPGVW